MAIEIREARGDMSVLFAISHRDRHGTDKLCLRDQVKG